MHPSGLTTEAMTTTVTDGQMFNEPIAAPAAASRDGGNGDRSGRSGPAGMCDKYRGDKASSRPVLGRMAVPKGAIVNVADTPKWQVSQSG